MRPLLRRISRSALALSLASTTIVASRSNAAGDEGTTTVQVLAFNDLHGNLEPPSGSSGRIGSVDTGGVEYLATHVRALRATNPNTVLVSTGDLVGASPLLSALFQDEPTIEAADLLGVDLNVVGNHEFDKGVARVKRLERGGCATDERCFGPTPYGGSTFPFLAANVVDAKTGRSIFPPYWVKEVDGARIGFIGVVLRETPTIVVPSGVAGVRFLDEATTLNRWAAVLEDRGVRAVVAMVHQGGRQSSGGPNDCNGFAGPVVDIVQRSSRAIDAFLTAHTHEAYRCTVEGRPVIQGASFGRLLSKVDLTVQRGRDGDVTAARATNVLVTRDVPRAPEMTALIARWRERSGPRADRVVGRVAVTFSRTADAAGQSSLGGLIADSQRWATRSAANGGAQLALMNPGGIRTDLVLDQRSGSEQPGEITYAEAFAVQPFGNNLVTLTLTGDQLRRVLEQQLDNPGPGQARILQVSSGFEYAYAPGAPAGSRVDAASMRLDGRPIEPTGRYRVTVNSFLADGGDNFTVLTEGTDRLGGVVDLDALEGYLQSLGAPAVPSSVRRVTRR